MASMRHLAPFLLAVAAIIPLHLAADDDRPPTVPAAVADLPVIQVAVLLDDSGSMQGLIQQARAHLWDVVGKLAGTRRDGRRPRVEVALYHYGDRPFLAAPLVPFTTDLDRMSAQLFAINGGGGEECCGEVIRNSLVQLAWSTRPQDLRLIIIAGNEPFDQGGYDWRDACREAAQRGIRVNTIHCGSAAEGVQGQWDQGARLGNGIFSCIDHNVVERPIVAPQDDRLGQLNLRLNATYCAYGRDGAAGREEQSRQDANAAAMAPQAAASRAVAKASAAYDNARWDLVDAEAQGIVDLAALSPAELPAELASLDQDGLRAALAAKAAERSAIQAEIAALAKERDAFVAAERAAAGNPSSLGSALVEAVSGQAAAAGYVVE
jgi:hypothetical protein